jgi:hypothetical protein
LQALTAPQHARWALERGATRTAQSPSSRLQPPPSKASATWSAGRFSCCATEAMNASLRAL